MQLRACFSPAASPIVEAVPGAPLSDLLKAYRPIDPDDAACAVRFAAFVAAQPRCFDRGLEIGHVTGSAWIVDQAGERVLLTHHAKLDIWVQPGGHCDGDSDVAAVALKEAVEETGLCDLERVSPEIFDLDIHTIPARGAVPAHEHFDVRFAFRVPAGASEAFVVSDESHDLAWVRLEDFERFTRERSMLRMREKWLRRR
jgi:8-oxo-dGTP pyrophosphatase MutT (NUDIX family)